jgi:signal transduction histidine kinase/DNA-binding response OmpR family regulator
LLGGDDATLLWWDPAVNGLRVLADTFLRPFPRIVAVGEGTAGIAFERGEQVLVEDYPGWEHAVPDALARGMKSVVAMPLLVQARPVGALTLSFTTPRRFEAEDLRLLSLLAAQVAPALEAARLHDAVLQISSELREASAAKSKFLANMSHELRTPLNAILGFAELLIDEPQGGYEADRRKQFLEQIYKSGKHLLDLINDILDLAKVEAGQMDLRRLTFSLRDVVRSAIDTVQPLAAAKKLSLIVEQTADTALFADQGKVSQMLLNLLSNAIKFTPEGGRITVAVAELDNEVRLSVADTGIGITAADQEKLFVEFQQVGERPSGGQQGTGLGLALTRRLAELHGGRVWVESEPGAGSRFYVALPLKSQSDALLEADAVATRESDGPLVMVVEDQNSAAALLSVTLRRAGYQVKVVRSGADVLESAVRLRPDAITLDILLPGVDGWEILRSLKESPETRNIPVVVVSVLDDRSLGFALGADDYLVKPAPREKLLEFVTRHTLVRKDGERAVRILAVDDDAVALQLLRDSLAPQFTLLTAEDGVTGIDMARSERPDAVILDLLMPMMSGFEVAAALKSDPNTRDIPILILTAKNLTVDDKAQLNGNVNRVMQKGQAGASELVTWLKRQPARHQGS